VDVIIERMRKSMDDHRAKKFSAPHRHHHERRCPINARSTKRQSFGDQRWMSPLQLFTLQRSKTFETAWLFQLASDVDVCSMSGNEAQGALERL
jgi:hypothetical protein